MFSSVSKHLKFKISYLEGPLDHDLSLVEGGVDSTYKLNWSVPEIFPRRMLPPCYLSALPVTIETLPLLSWFCIS